MRTRPLIFSDKESLLKSLHSSYTARVRMNGTGPFGLPVFTCRITRLNNVKRMLKKFPEGCTPVIAVRDITVEVDELVQSAGGQTISQPEVYSTEESIEESAR